ncbi:methyltransferase cognate corrinoid protein [Sporomusa sp.]|uniref:methyltransferase cognate corrinoid protein n=1 Tax=Sporomusa sp. TaxID=2078658 RepID=UPI002CC652CE|nr:methyltransferase cognate corrinoid protein [Sporomusa sp.]HWR45859.1 methyltransferase cognate corrinoid protein [Sporomusa sp.]
MSLENYISEAIDAVINCDPPKAAEIATQALAEGCDPVQLLSEGFSVGIREMGEKFGQGEVFLPQLILAAETMKAATGILEAALKAQGEMPVKGTMIIATVEGDLHDIGKGIVISMLSTQGIKVIDLGRDVKTDKIIQAAIDHNADIIGTCALLTTTMMAQKKLEDELHRRNLRQQFKTVVGGAPCTQRWADKIGADAYAEDAAEALTKVLELLKTKAL